MSDKNTSIEELKTKIAAFCTEREWDAFHEIKDLAIGAVTESSELLEIFRFISEEKCEEMLKDPQARIAIGDELADVLFFILRIAEKYNFDMSEVFNAKLEKNAQKYPVEKAKGSNKKYTHYET